MKNLSAIGLSDLKEKFSHFSIPESMNLRFKGIRSSLFSKGPRQLLVVEYDGFELHAAIMTKSGTSVVIAHISESHLPNPAQALEEALSQFRDASIAIPSKAVLLAPGVIPALLELPVPPGKPRPSFQMQELVKWELEPLVAEHTAVWPIEAIFLGKGYLTYQQVQDIQQQMEEHKQQKPPVRFDDLAIQQGLITRNQVDECVLIQETLQSIDEDIICGWSPQSPAGDDETGPFQWLACAIGRTQRSQWMKLFQKHDLELDWIFPLIGCSGAALNGVATKSTDLVVEIRPGLLGCTRISGGSVEAIRVYPTQGKLPSPSMLDHSVTTGTEAFWFCGRDPQLPTLPQSFSTTFEKPVQEIPLPLNQGSLDQDALPPNWSAYVGAAYYALDHTGTVPTVAIPAQDPKPPIWQRKEWWAMAGLGVALLLVAILEISLAIRLNSAQEVNEQITGKLRKVETDVNKANKRIEQISKIEETITQRREELQLLKEKQIFLQDKLTRRERFIPVLLDSITSSVSMEVLIDKITEHDESDIEVTGWALTEQAAQRFAQNLGISLGPWEQTVVDFKVWDNTGRLGIQGYALSLQIIPTSVERDTAQEKN